MVDMNVRSLSENGSISEVLVFFCTPVRHRIGRFDSCSTEIYLGILQKILQPYIMGNIICSILYELFDLKFSFLQVVYDYI